MSGNYEFSPLDTGRFHLVVVVPISGLLLTLIFLSHTCLGLQGFKSNITANTAWIAVLAVLLCSNILFFLYYRGWQINQMIPGLIEPFTLSFR